MSSTLLPWADVVTAYGDIPALDADRPLATSGETWREYLRRTTTALGEIVARHDGHRILVVGHGETVDTAVRYFLDLPATSRPTDAGAAQMVGLAWGCGCSRPKGFVKTGTSSVNAETESIDMTLNFRQADPVHADGPTYGQWAGISTEVL